MSEWIKAKSAAGIKAGMKVKVCYGDNCYTKGKLYKVVESSVGLVVLCNNSTGDDDGHDLEGMIKQGKVEFRPLSKFDRQVAAYIESELS